jgi:hypothetical protein
MKLTNATRFGNEAMPAAPAAEPQPAATPAPEAPAMPEAPMDQAKFSGKNPKFGAVPVDAQTANSIINGLKNPLNLIALGSMAQAVHTGTIAGNKFFNTNPIKESIAKALTEVARYAKAMNPNAREEVAQTILKETVTKTV